MVRGFLAEKEGFEPSIPFWGIHDFQSCALGQLRDFSIGLIWNQLAYNTPWNSICQVLILLFYKLFGAVLWRVIIDKNGVPV